MEGRSTVEDRRLRNSYHRVCYVFVEQAASAVGGGIHVQTTQLPLHSYSLPTRRLRFGHRGIARPKCDLIVFV